MQLYDGTLKFCVMYQIFSPTLLQKAKKSVGNKESGLEKIVVDMLGPKIKLR